MFYCGWWLDYTLSIEHLKMSKEDNPNPKIAAIIQARMGSSRLPGKVIKQIPPNSECTILSRLISSLKMVSGIHDIWLATTQLQADCALEEYAKSLDVRVFRGSENDVLSRFLGILELENYQSVLRFTADNPCVDVSAVEFTLKNHLETQSDYTRLNGMPVGMHVEIINSQTLIDLSKKSDLISDDKEHVTTYIKRNSGFNKNMLSILDYVRELNLELSDLQIKKLSELRMTIDHDYEYQTVSEFYKYAESKDGNHLLQLLSLWNEQANQKP